MTTYEKAKAYEYVSQKVKDFFEGKQKMYSDVKQTLEYLFPELAESEDERMLRNFKSYLQEEIESYTYDCRDEEDRQKLKMFKYILAWLEKQGEKNNIVEQLTAFAVHLNKRGAFRDDLCMDFEHEAQSFIEFQNRK